MTSETKASSNEKKDPSISIHLSAMNKKLIILELFKGYSSMISKLWNLPTKMTSLFNINFLTNDQKEYIILNNGILIRLETLGAISVDISGFTEISLWSQYAKISLKKRHYF